MAIEKLKHEENGFAIRERWGIKNAEGETMSSVGLTSTLTRFGSEWVSSLLFGGVATDPEYRRYGYVRETIDFLFGEAKERGWKVSLLHPFSFAYYRKFGYERVADHLIAEFPLSKLEYIPRCADLVRLKNEKHIQDAMAVYEAFCPGRNLLRARPSSIYPINPNIADGVTYLHYDAAGRADGYITFRFTKDLHVNHYENGWLYVKEIAYTSRGALIALLGFLRLFDGELDMVRLENIAMCPEVDFVLRHYTHTAYKILPDISARILDTEALLRANIYPDIPGEFTLRVLDERKLADGVWHVRYEGGKAEIDKLHDSACADITADVAPLAQLLYGAYNVDMKTISFLAEVDAPERTADFLRAFPKRPCGMFEHF